MAASNWDSGLLKHFSTTDSRRNHGQIENGWWQEVRTRWCLQSVTCSQTLSIIHPAEGHQDSSAAEI